MDIITIFENDVKNIPFIECIDKDNLYNEYIKTNKIPDFEMYLYSISKLEKVRKSEGTYEYDNILQEYHSQFMSEIRSKSLSSSAYRFNINETSTFRHLTGVQDAYNNFLETLRNRQDNSIDRYKEPELQAKNIIRLLNIFDDEVKTKIIDSIIRLTNENDISEFIRLKYNNKNYNNDNNSLLEFFKTKLSEFKITFKPTNEQLLKTQNTIQKDDPEPLPEKEIDKIRLLHETGIINFLIDKYPTTNPNQIAKFFELISSEPMTAKNNNSLFTTDKTNVKYPMDNLSITKRQKIRNLMLDFGFITEL